MRAIMRRCCGAVVFAALALATAPASAREIVSFDARSYSAGTIVVRTSERRLYLVLGNGQAIRYTVGVGRAGMQWAGVSKIDGKYLSPAWAPPLSMRRDKSTPPQVIPGGSPRNPMGVAALTLAGGD